MSAFQQSMRKLGVRAGLLAGASAAVLAIGGVSAGSAMAAPTCPNNSVINGRGSSLQKIAQTEVWTVKYDAACANAPKVSYESTSSGSGLEAMGFKGGVVNTAFQYIGTDDGPNATQIASAEGAVSHNTKPVIVPVSQTAISVVVHPPAGCTFKAGTGITYAELNKVFGGNGITNWNQFSNVTGTCNEAVKRVVRSDGSGTSYQFKNYLSTLETNATIKAEGLPCTTEGHTKWGEMLEVGAENKPNITWPQCAGGTTVTAVSGGGGVAETVASTSGAIGYAALPDAKAKTAEVARLQNGTISGIATYAEPGNSSTSTARCVNARYTVPAEGRTTGTGVAVDWSTVFGAQPAIGGSEYPLCTLTYDAGWKSYEGAGFTKAQGEAVFDYINNYVVAAASGQEDLKTAKKWYSTLPTTGGAGSATDVQSAAEWAASKINH
jgi:ABC-type phosphate transport system substrate-binding protein